MKQEALLQFTELWMPGGAFIIFFLVFLICTAWVFRKSRKKFYDKMSLMPLQNRNTK